MHFILIISKLRAIVLNAECAFDNYNDELLSAHIKQPKRWL